MTVVTHKKLWGEGESYKTGSQAKREAMARYAEWLLTPAEDREPSTKQALADELGVSTQTLRNYHKEAWLQREVTSRAKALARIDRLPDILATLYEQATDSENPRSVAAAKTYLDWLKETSQVREGELDVADLTDDDLIQVALAVLNQTKDH